MASEITKTERAEKKKTKDTDFTKYVLESLVSYKEIESKPRIIKKKTVSVQLIFFC